MSKIPVKALEGLARFGAADRRKTVPELLVEAAETFKQRNTVYGASYQRYGALLKAAFPADGVPALTNEVDMLRLNLLMMCLAKLQRYAHNFKRGGHQDSVRDLQVYAAMLEEATDV